VTDELHIFAQNKKLLNELNVETFISSYESIINSSNKYNLYENLKEVLDLPKYKKVNLRDIRNYLSEFDYPNNEICFKPLTLDGARGFRILSNKTDRLKQIMTEKPYNFYLTVEELELLFNKSDYNCDVLLSEYLPGKEYTVDTFVEDNKIKSHTIRERLKLKDHISFVGKTVRNTHIEEQIRLINSKFNFNGSIGYQFKENSHDIPLLLECNPRLQGATILSCKKKGVPFSLKSILPFINIILYLNI
jgi:carbamoyl-phosphate synthase large subunit